MTSAELAQLEENLGVTMPEEYKRIALDNPFAGLHTADYELCRALAMWGKIWRCRRTRWGDDGLNS